MFICCVQIGLQIDCLINELKNTRKSANKTLDHVHRSHVKLLEFKKSFEHIFKPLNFLQCGQSIIYMCMLLFVSKMETDESRKLQVITFSLASSFQLIFICFVGQHLTNKFDQLFQSVYNIDWYNFNRMDKRAFLIMITEMQKPVSVTTYFNAKLSAVSYASVSFIDFWREI